jgi:D-xylose transport system permease protein
MSTANTASAEGLQLDQKIEQTAVSQDQGSHNASQSRRSTQGTTSHAKEFIKRNGVWIAFLVLAIGAAILTQGGFLAPRNLTNLLRQASINGILAAGMTLVILHGGIDLSIGSLVALSGIAVGVSQVAWGWNGNGVEGALMSGGLALLVGTTAGIVNGGLVALLGIAPFVITLGMMVIARGLALIFSDGASISPMGEALTPLADAYLPMPLSIALIAVILGGIVFAFRRRILDVIFPAVVFGLISYAFITYRGFPMLTVFLLGAMIAASFLLMRTTFGRSVYAIGSNERAALWAGVPVKRVVWIVYALMGFLSGLAGLLLTARLNGSDPNAGQLFELDAIAAVVIGGTSLKGGTGTIMGSFIGALTIATLNNGMDLLGVPSFYQMVFKGVIIVGAVALDKGQRQQA